MDGCNTPTVKKDYKENKTLSQVANCLNNIEMLLRNQTRNDNPEVDIVVTSDVGETEPTQRRQQMNNVAPTKKSSRTRTKSSQVSDKKPGDTQKPPARKVPRRQSLPDKLKGTKKTEPVSKLTDVKTKEVGNLEKKNKKGESKLHVACNKGTAETVSELLRLGANPNSQDHAGWTPLHDVVAANRLDVAEVLLAAEANPSVPSTDERITPLHDAVDSGEAEMVRLLVSYGADREAKNKLGQTPRSLAAESENPEIRDILENTRVVRDLNETAKTNSQSKKLNISLSRKVARQSSLTRLCSDACHGLGLEKPSVEVSPSTTHLLLEPQETPPSHSYHYLAALAVGARLVRTAWLTESHQQGKLLEEESFVLSFNEEDQEAFLKVQEMIAAQQPGLFAGLHFYLSNNISPHGRGLSREDLSSLVRLCGGKLVGREPDPEWIPADEVSVPHHAPSQSSLAGTSHIILYREGEGEPQLKYNMKHVKTLPVGWLLNCARTTTLVDP